MYVFRTVITNSPTETDATPQIFRKEDSSIEKMEYELTAEDLNLLNEEEKKAFISERALSVHEDE